MYTKAYTDGSYRSNTATWGYVVVKDKKIIAKASGKVTKVDATKNGMQVLGELSAAMRAVLWAKKNNTRVVICYDYSGVEKWCTSEWRAKKPVTQKYAEFMNQNKKYIVGFQKVKAHTGNRFNELADKLAGSVAV